MSNPAVKLLSETTIKGKNFRIEDNLGESIHIHIGDFRFELTIEEFKEFANSIYESAREFLSISGIDLEMIDSTSLDWNWLSRYSEIKKISLKRVKMKDLYTRDYVDGNDEMLRIMKVNESLKMKVLTKKENMVSKKNSSSVDKERLQSILDVIKEKGYPYDGKYIMVNQFNQIYDGDHRAAGLLFLYGEEFTIPVLEVEFESEPTIDEQLRTESRLIEEYNKKKKNYTEPIKQWSEEMNFLDITLNEFEELLDEKKIRFYIVDYPLKNEDKKKVVDLAIFVNEGTLMDICRNLNISYYGANYYRKYKFLYSMQRGVYIKLKDKEVMLFDRLCCKSKYEESFVPLDKEIQKFAKEELFVDKRTKMKFAGEITKLIYVICNAVFNQNGFDTSDCDYILKHRDLLTEGTIRNLLKKEFFLYTDEFLKLLGKGEFDKAFDYHELNSNY